MDIPIRDTLKSLFIVACQTTRRMTERRNSNELLLGWNAVDPVAKAIG